MKERRDAGTGVVTIALLGALSLVCAPVALAAQADEPLPEIEPPRAAAPSDGPLPEDYVTLEVREAELVLTNISDRPINAWSVKTVVRSSQGHEAYGSSGTDAYRAPILSGGDEGWLQPGESVTLEKGAKPWLREDLRGPGAGVYYEVGVLAFEGGEAVGDPEEVDRMFQRRLEDARSALKAMEVARSMKTAGALVVHDLPSGFRGPLEVHGSPAAAAQVIYDMAWEEYNLAVGNLRPQDLVGLPVPAEVLK